MFSINLEDKLSKEFPSPSGVRPLTLDGVYKRNSSAGCFRPLVG